MFLILFAVVLQIAYLFLKIISGIYEVLIKAHPDYKHKNRGLIIFDIFPNLKS